MKLSYPYVYYTSGRRHAKASDPKNLQVGTYLDWYLLDEGGTMV